MRAHNFQSPCSVAPLPGQPILVRERSTSTPDSVSIRDPRGGVAYHAAVSEFLASLGGCCTHRARPRAAGCPEASGHAAEPGAQDPAASAARTGRARPAPAGVSKPAWRAGEAAAYLRFFGAHGQASGARPPVGGGVCGRATVAVTPALAAGCRWVPAAASMFR